MDESIKIQELSKIYNNFATEIKVGSVTYYIDKKFNWFNRLMFKICFGLDVRTIKL